MRNKEEKLRNKLKKQGLSEKEIEKIVKSKNKKLAPKLIVGTFATALIVAGVVFVVNNFKKGNSAIKNETPAEKIAKEEDEKLKEELEKDKPDKNPDDSSFIPLHHSIIKYLKRITGISLLVDLD